MERPEEPRDRPEDESEKAEPEPETRHDQKEGVERTPMGQTDLEQAERESTDPGD